MSGVGDLRKGASNKYNSKLILLAREKSTLCSVNYDQLEMSRTAQLVDCRRYY